MPNPLIGEIINLQFALSLSLSVHHLSLSPSLCALHTESLRHQERPHHAHETWLKLGTHGILIILDLTLVPYEC